MKSAPHRDPSAEASGSSLTKYVHWSQSTALQAMLLLGLPDTNGYFGFQQPP